jgi:Domain of unknown function (DUF4190)
MKTRFFTLFLGLILPFFAFAAGSSLGDGCAQIVLQNGDVISADITQITENTILYKPCGSKTAEPLRLEKSKILKIKAPNGDVIFDGQNNKSAASGGTRTNGMAIAGFVCSIVLGPLFGLIFSIIGLNQIKKSPEKYTGEGLAIAGIIISIVYLLLLLATIRR